MKELIVATFGEKKKKMRPNPTRSIKNFAGDSVKKSPQTKERAREEMGGRYGCLIKRDVQAFSHLREKEGDKGKLLAGQAF